MSFYCTVCKIVRWFNRVGVRDEPDGYVYTYSCSKCHAIRERKEYR